MCVLERMAFQEGPVSEGAMADIAGEGSLDPMCAHVDVKGTFLSEALAADRALERPDAGVYHHMLEQVVAEGE